MRISLLVVLRTFFLLLIFFGLETTCSIFAGKNFEQYPAQSKAAPAVSAPVLPPDSVQVLVGTFLGNGTRNYYGDSIGDKLDVIWKTFLGKGTTIVTAEKGVEEWFGAGWTGQPLVVRENQNTYLIQGAFDHHLKKIDARSGKVIWNYEYDDILKGTGTIWKNESAADPLNRIVILQGSRKGVQNSIGAAHVSSLRGVSFFTGKELWRMNIAQTESYSRDVDASALIFSDTAYIGLENGRFVKFDPGKKTERDDSVNRPRIFEDLPLYNEADHAHHGGNLVTESSPARIGDHIYITAGSGHVYGYNLRTNVMDWDFFIGSDMDGTPVVTSDSCLLVEVEKQYISGKGGVFKLNPRRAPETCVDWYYPTGDNHFASWDGGVIGSVAVNDAYNDGTFPHLAAFTGIDGNLDVLRYDVLSDTLVLGPDGKTKYSSPALKFRKHIGPSISTPVFAKNKLVAAGYNGIQLFAFDTAGNFTEEAFFSGNFEASPVANAGRIYIASRDGYLYCFGDTAETTNLAAVTNAKPKPVEEVKVPVAYLPKANTSPAQRAIMYGKKLLAEKPPVVPADVPVVAAVAPVKQKEIPPPVQTNVDANKPCHLIAGVFRSKENAGNFEKLWKERGMDASILVSPKGMFYVAIGHADESAGLAALQAQVKTKYGQDAWIFVQH